MKLPLFTHNKFCFNIDTARLALEIGEDWEKAAAADFILDRQAAIDSRNQKEFACWRKANAHLTEFLEALGYEKGVNFLVKAPAL